MISKLEKKLYKDMFRIRAVEEEIARRYPEGMMRCPVHLSIGQESVPAMFSQCVRKDDFAISTHRGHAHYLAKGGNLDSMISELYGKETGCSNGKGGSMHLIDLNVNFMGTSAIVGNSIPVGVGLALSIQLHKTDQISCVFIGDGAIEEGVFYESVNYAAVKKLPVLFICENNLYSVYSPLSVRQPKARSITSMVHAMGIKSSQSEAKNINESYDMMRHGFDSVRSGEGPVFLEFLTYRWREHCGHNFDNHIGYRTQDEYDKWFECDPLNSLERKLLSLSNDNNGFIESLKFEIDREIQQAFRLAETADFPNRIEAYQGEYA
jgi:TPP-dependent pyruvate/acetoin dehydrogenase alpha subunit